ncbi:MAG: hypothetical protein ACE5ER_09065 [Nitrospinaceae bacterium]
MEDREKFEDTFHLIKSVWTLLLIGLYMACFLNEYTYPGFRDTPLEGEEIYWKVQRVFYFGLLGVGFLADLVQFQLDRRKAFMFLMGSLILGGLSTVIGVYQFRFIKEIMNLLGVAQGASTGFEAG